MAHKVDRLSAVNIEDYDTVTRETMETARLLVSADRCSLFLVEPTHQQLTVRFAPGMPLVRVPLGTGIAGTVALTGETLNIPDAYSDSRFNKEIDIKTGYKTNSILCMPVTFEGTIVAVAQLINKSSGPFLSEDEQLFRAFSTFAAVALRNARLVLDKAQASERTHLLLDTVESLNQISMGDTCALNAQIMNGAKRIVGCDHINLYEVSRETNELQRHDNDEKHSYSIQAGIAGAVASNNMLINVPDTSMDARFNADVDSIPGVTAKSILSMPVQYQGMVVGVTQLINKADGSFTEDDEHMVRAFATFAGISLWRDNLYKSLHNAFVESAALQTPRNPRSLPQSPHSKHKEGQGMQPRQLQLSASSADRVSVGTSEFNVFEFWPTNPNKCSQLIPLAVHIFDSHGFLESLGLPAKTLYHFVLEVSKCYRNVPYHNWLHAFDVTQTVALFLSSEELRNYLPEVDRFMLLVAALCHDLDHMGLNNSFLYKAESPYGMLSHKAGARSALEVHHCNVAIRILGDENCNVINSLPEEHAQRAWRVLIDTILATDIATDAEHRSAFQELFSESHYNPANPDHCLVLLRMVLKLADISNVAKPFEISKRWGEQITHEFTSTGDTLDAPPVPIEQLAKAQIGFIDNCPPFTPTALVLAGRLGGSALPGPCTRQPPSTFHLSSHT
eukprot:NODE_194_length_2211_cov_44.141073_g165_i0.p1 GENE.NODE_194_length_2211_cov_44.141073_g165_i0~~NODE_194_length_2211_cov_44.141073_g165_i0.p1  ORF type:complete len:695 (-),score=195.03 NODE_194_length_2211_cov_44.141073_g165_i0:126-2153(-)